MAYTIEFSDNTTKNPIEIEDNTINTETSLKLPGKNSLGYGQVIAENLIRLLENFASPVEPINPIEGQVWYDNNAEQLKVYDGTKFSSAGGLQKSLTRPEVADSVDGDLWVDQSSQQLYLFNGNNWILVGPEFSDGLTTGATVKQIVATDNNEYNVVVLEVEQNAIAIVSNQTFTPKQTIQGFVGKEIKPGINLAVSQGDVLASTDAQENFVKYHGVAEKAENLIVGDKVVSAGNFLRSDVESTTQYPLRIRNADALKLGVNNEISFSIDNINGVISNSVQNGNIDFRLRQSGQTKTVLSLASDQKVGINNQAPEEALDVDGNIAATGNIKGAGGVESNDFQTGSLVITGGAGISGNLNVGGGATFKEGLVIGNLDIPENDARNDLIIPDLDSARNIGRADLKFKNIYASSFVGNVQGNVFGSVSGNAGTASRLTNSTVFQFTGDVETVSNDFDGSTGATKTFNLTIAPTVINTKDLTTETFNSDQILVERLDGLNTGLKRITRQTFLSNIPGVVPVGGMMIWPTSAVPLGWAWCNGAELDINIYSLLFNVIGYTYTPVDGFGNPTSTEGTFVLPDLRGRLPLGAYNMGSTTPSTDTNRVTGSSAQTIAAVGGNEEVTIDVENLPEHEHDLKSSTGQQFYAYREIQETPTPSGVSSGSFEVALSDTSERIASSGGVLNPTTGQPLDVTNPHLTMSYIIYTGVN